MYTVTLKPSAEKSLRKLPSKDHKRILATLTLLADNPLLGKKLKGDFELCYSLRVWPYRIIYIVRKTELLIIVIAIGHRQGVYR